eukprot:361320-Chlamydomonas_euryale.AAC.3
MSTLSAPLPRGWAVASVLATDAEVLASCGLDALMMTKVSVWSDKCGGVSDLVLMEAVIERRWPGAGGGNGRELMAGSGRRHWTGVDGREAVRTVA